MGLVVQQRGKRVYVDVPAVLLDDPGRGLGDRSAGDQGGAGLLVSRAGKESWSTNLSLKSGRSESSTYFTSSSSAAAPTRSRRDSRAIFAPSPATLPAETMRSTGSLGTSPIRTADAGDEVGAERSGEQHLLDVVVLEAELLEQQGPAGGDRGLAELQLAHVALGEVDAVADVGVRRRPVEDEDPLLADLGEPVGERRRLRGDLVLGQEPATGVEQADADQLGDGVDEPGTAQALGRHVADDLQA